MGNEQTNSNCGSSHRSTLVGKWSISTNEEDYHDLFDSFDDAVAEGKASEFGRFWVGQCVDPVQPEDLFCGNTIYQWIENQVWGHGDYMGDWAEGHVSPTDAQMSELADELRPLIAAWLDRHKLRPRFWNIDPKSVVCINADDA